MDQSDVAQCDSCATCASSRMGSNRHESCSWRFALPNENGHDVSVSCVQTRMPVVPSPDVQFATFATSQ